MLLVPSPHSASKTRVNALVLGEGGSVLQGNEGVRASFLFTEYPSPDLIRFTTVLPLSRKGRATVLAVKRFAMADCL